MRLTRLRSFHGEVPGGDLYRRGHTVRLTQRPCLSSARGDSHQASRNAADDRWPGDTQWVDTLIDADRDADLFIAEACFHEKPITRHLSYRTVHSHLQDIGAKRVLLTHLHADMLKRADQLSLEVAHDGMVVDL